MRLRVIFVIGFDDRRVRQRRMDIDRHIELGGPFPDRPEPLIIVKDAAGHAVDHRAFEAELGDGALQFVGRGARIGGRHHGEGGKTIRVALNRLMKPVIGPARQRRPGFGVDRLQSGDRMRQDLQIDAGLIHLADAQRAEIVEPLDDITTSPGTAAELLDLGVEVMLFERDDVGLLCHFCPPSLCLARAGLVRQGRAKIKPSRWTRHAISAAP